jgi:integrase
MRKRANGEGSVYRIADDCWRGVVSFPDGLRKYVRGRTQHEVLSKLADLRRLREEGAPMPRDRETFGDLAAEWLETARMAVRPRTWERYEQYMRVHAVPVLGKIPLAKLQPVHLQRLYTRKLASGLSPTTVHHLHMAIHRALHQAVRWALISRNVAELVDPPRMARKEMHVLNHDEAQQLLRTLAGDRLEALCVLAITTGMREGELLALRWRHVDLERGVLAVLGTAQRIRAEGLVIRETKTARSRRQVVLSATALAALGRHRVLQATERLRAGDRWEDLDLVFPNRVGRIQEATTLLQEEFYPLLERAGLRRIRFHDLRHTAATLMLSRGVHPKVASDVLGHSTVGITLDHYSHVSDAMHRDAARRMDDLFGRGS